MCAIFVIPVHCTDSVELLNAKHLQSENETGPQ